MFPLSSGKVKAALRSTQAGKLFRSRM